MSPHPPSSRFLLNKIDASGCNKHDTKTDPSGKVRYRIIEKASKRAREEMLNCLILQTEVVAKHLTITLTRLGRHQRARLMKTYWRGLEKVKKEYTMLNDMLRYSMKVETTEGRGLEPKLSVNLVIKSRHNSGCIKSAIESKANEDLSC